MILRSNRSRRQRGRAALIVLGALSAMLGAVLVAGCSGNNSAEPGKNPKPQGEVVYRQSCAACHGKDLRGTGRGPSFFSEVYEPGHHPDAAFRSAIENGSPAHHWGFGDMPPVSGLDADKVSAVIGYIRQQQETHGFEAYQPG